MENGGTKAGRNQGQEAESLAAPLAPAGGKYLQVHVQIRERVPEPKPRYPTGVPPHFPNQPPRKLIFLGRKNRKLLKCGPAKRARELNSANSISQEILISAAFIYGASLQQFTMFYSCPPCLIYSLVFDLFVKPDRFCWIFFDSSQLFPMSECDAVCEWPRPRPLVGN